jgi:hypothetical protein
MRRWTFCFIGISLILGLIFSFYSVSFDASENQTNVLFDDNESPHQELQVVVGQALPTEERSTRSLDDQDNDGLLDQYEVLFGTDMDDPDTDDDGVLDGNEKLNPTVNPSHEENDPDGDGWNNARDVDSDDDGIYDGTECGLTYGDVYGDINFTDLDQGNFIPDADPNTVTNMTNPDTDGDTLSDGIEDSNANGKYEPTLNETDPLFKDYDNDHMHDDYEDDDDDNDGMSDVFETTYPNALDPLDDSDKLEDYDGDGFSNYDEYLGNDREPGNDDWTDPEDYTSQPEKDSDDDGVNDKSDAFPNDPAASKDMDNDGYPDEWNPGKAQNDSTSNPPLEIDQFIDDPTAHTDTDGDNMPDEIIGQSDTLIEDTDDDDDGLPDWWEEQYGFDRRNSSDAGLDPDQDGFSNMNEYLWETNPQDSNDYPEFSARDPIDDEQWGDFIAFLFLVIIGMMVFLMILAYFIIQSRTRDAEFWEGTFGGAEDKDSDSRDSYKRPYRTWERKVENEREVNTPPKTKYKLEIIGGPADSELEQSDLYSFRKSRARGSVSEKTKKQTKATQFKGKHCLWCDKGITRKYIKTCPHKLTPIKRCADGPFCSKRCLNEHLQTVPHHEEFIY